MEDAKKFKVRSFLSFKGYLRIISGLKAYTEEHSSCSQVALNSLHLSEKWPFPYGMEHRKNASQKVSL